jgi:hypothetical protein
MITKGHPYYFDGGAGEQPELPPAQWTHFYWPIALLVSVLGFLGSLIFHIGDPFISLWVGVILLAVPETTVALMRRWQDTLSVWVWSTLRITQGQPIREWTAEHFLLLGTYLALAGTVCAYVASHAAVGWAIAACWMSFWLTFHFFWKIWT